jgi:lipid-A-disaccharide synthase
MRLVLSAGEASGDHIGANLARALKEECPDIELAGLVGPRMRAAGVQPWHGLDELNVMGLFEVLAHLPRLLRLRRQFRRRITTWQADAFVGIDAPDFNLGLARQVRRHGVTAMHYVSPSVWAWRSHRIGKISRSLDLLLTLFPFEPELYHPHGLDARFVGHPLADELSLNQGPDRAREALKLEPGRPVIALLPGSRNGEIDRHGQLIGETAIQLRDRLPDATLIVLLAAADQEERLRAHAGNRFERAQAMVVAGRTREGLITADLAVAASGTVTLEAFLIGCPQVVYYRLASSTYWMARSLRLVKSRHVSLPNILCQDQLVPERLQHEATSERLVSDCMDWLEHPERMEKYRMIANQWLNRLAIDSGRSAARAILEKLDRG